MIDAAFKDLHCLIVDDEAAILQVFEGMLRSLGVGKVSTGINGSDALTKLATSQRPVDVILCDLMMAAGNGLQLLKAIRTGQVKSVRPDACFVLVTSTAAPDLVRAAKDLDVSGYLMKPLAREKLRAAIIKGRQRHFAIDPMRYAQVMIPAAAF